MRIKPIYFVYGIGVGLLIYFWFLQPNPQYVMVEKNGNWIIFFLGAIYVGEATFNVLRIKSPKLVADGVSHTSDGIVTQVGSWGVATMGGIRALAFFLKGAEGTLVTPINNFHYVGESIVNTTFVVPVDKSELPSEIVNLIEKEKQFKAPYYFGIMSNDMMTHLINNKEERLPFVETIYKTVSVEDLISLYKILASENYSLREMNKGKFGTIGRHVGDFNKIRKRVESRKPTRIVMHSEREPKYTEED